MVKKSKISEIFQANIVADKDNRTFLTYLVPVFQKRVLVQNGNVFDLHENEALGGNRPRGCIFLWMVSQEKTCFHTEAKANSGMSYLENCSIFTHAHLTNPLISDCLQQSNLGGLGELPKTYIFLYIWLVQHAEGLTCDRSCLPSLYLNLGHMQNTDCPHSEESKSSVCLYRL